MKPAVFRELSFEVAAAAAGAEKKWLLVDFTADWCAPCKNMDATTWRDSAVVQWLNERAVAIQLDVDHDPTGKRLGVRSMPTVVIFDGATELDRTSGARSGAKLLEWLEGLRSGRTEVESLRALAKTDLQARMHLSRVLLGRGSADEAAVEALWLWDHALEVEPAWVGVRLSFLIGHLGELLQASPFARKELTQRRDALLVTVSGAKPTPAQIRDFTALNLALGDAQSTLQWFDQVKSRAAQLQLESDLGLKQALESADRWADLGRMIQKPLERLEAEHTLMKDVLADLPKGMDPDAIAEGFRYAAATLCRSLHFAHRTQDEVAVRERALALDGSEAMRAALEASSAAG